NKIKTALYGTGLFQAVKNIRLFKIILLLSFIFLGYYLYRADILHIPKIISTSSLILSFVFLGLSFIMQANNWYQILKSEFPIKYRDAIISVGLTVFTKYIPGKVFVIVGKASYINEKYHYKQKSLIEKSLDSQLLIIWLG